MMPPEFPSIPGMFERRDLHMGFTYFWEASWDTNRSPSFASFASPFKLGSLPSILSA